MGNGNVPPEPRRVWIYDDKIALGSNVPFDDPEFWPSVVCKAKDVAELKAQIAEKKLASSTHFSLLLKAEGGSWAQESQLVDLPSETQLGTGKLYVRIVPEESSSLSFWSSLSLPTFHSRIQGRWCAILSTEPRFRCVEHLPPFRCCHFGRSPTKGEEG
jgi:hypothetical protein